jgi:hypothetical protein
MAPRLRMTHALQQQPLPHPCWCISSPSRPSCKQPWRRSPLEHAPVGPWHSHHSPITRSRCKPDPSPQMLVHAAVALRSHAMLCYGSSVSQFVRFLDPLSVSSSDPGHKDSPFLSGLSSPPTTSSLLTPALHAVITIGAQVMRYLHSYLHPQLRHGPVPS